jgi:SAM-dependent methyltransferase
VHLERRTKIVATLGPASDAPEVLDRLLAAGVDCVRINCSHGVPDDLERRTAEARAAAERVSIAFELGDAEQLPYADDSFQTVVTMFGAMFAARPDRAAAELFRVTRPGGRIAMANWTPGGFIGEMLRATLAYVPAPAGIPSPLLWGTDDAVRARLGDGAASLSLTRRHITFEYPFGPEQVVNEFRLWYGPTLRAFAALNEVQRAGLQRDLEKLWVENNRANDGTTRVQSEYLEVVAIVK